MPDQSAAVYGRRTALSNQSASLYAVWTSVWPNRLRPTLPHGFGNTLSHQFRPAMHAIGPVLIGNKPAPTLPLFEGQGRTL